MSFARCQHYNADDFNHDYFDNAVCVCAELYSAHDFIMTFSLASCYVFAVAAAAAADDDAVVAVFFIGLTSHFQQNQSKTQAKVLHSPSTMCRTYVSTICYTVL